MGSSAFRPTPAPAVPLYAATLALFLLLWGALHDIVRHESDIRLELACVALAALALPWVYALALQRMDARWRRAGA